MNRSLLILIAVFVVVMGGIGVFFLLNYTPAKTPSPQGSSSGTSPVPNNTVIPLPQDRSKAAVQTAYRNELAKYESDNTKLFETVIVGDYAIQVWVGDVMGGQAVLKYEQSQRQWVLVDGGGGAWSVSTLVAVGVPQKTAEELLKSLSK